uniref:Uncharacterized protein n=1 Tax=Arundo donax TaxID=35708 RepID=A0A0A8Z9X4_ARUDO
MYRLISCLVRSHVAINMDFAITDASPTNHGGYPLCYSYWTCELEGATKVAAHLSSARHVNIFQDKDAARITLLPLGDPDRVSVFCCILLANRVPGCEDDWISHIWLWIFHSICI